MCRNLRQAFRFIASRTTEVRSKFAAWQIMRTQKPSLSRRALPILFLVLIAACHPAVQAQTPDPAAATANPAAPMSQARITQAIDEKNRIVLHGNQHPLARPEFDRGAVANAQPVNRILLLLQRSADQ
jgi:hypothetical protein